jgi:flagellar biosynthesis anti-sigma factor FlgM
MRIDNQRVQNLNTSSTQSSSINATSGDSSTSSVFSSASGSGDQVSLSASSNLVAHARNSTSADRQAKIAALKEQVQSGNYKPDLSEVSHAMVHELSRGASASS